MAIFGGNRPVWGNHFSVDLGDRDGYIRLAQKGRSLFELESVIDYGGETGLEDLRLSEETMAQLRHLEPAELGDTDLASIPAPMRWWVNTYGVHTPAALIHDRFIGSVLPPDLTEENVDRYFRFMLKDAGVRIGKRWIMWSAVALRTRWKSGGLKAVSIAVWAVLAIGGFIATLFAIAAGSWGWAALLVFPMPVIASLLWHRQFGAGVVASYVVLPFLVTPMVVSVALLSPFWLLEKIVSRILEPEVAGTEPIWVPVRRKPKKNVRGTSDQARGLSTDARAL